MKFVYLHGFASGPGSTKAQLFRERMEALGIKLSIPDLAQDDFEHLTISGQLRVVDREVKGGPSVLIGSSMGGYLAALYASEHPEVQKVVMLAPAFGFAQRWPQSLGAEAVGNWKRTGFMEVMHYAHNRPERVWWHLIEDGLAFPAEPEIVQPGLIFHGSADETVPVAFSETYAAKHPNVKLRILPSDHQLTDQVETIWKETAAFLFPSRPDT